MVTQGSPAAAAVVRSEDPARHGANVRRLMAQFGMTQADVVAATGLDERTVRSLLRGTARPHPRTLHKFARGLGVEIEELFHAPRQRAAEFDHTTNPAVARVIESRPELFADWSSADFDELFSRVAVGGELTDEGALEAAQAMNRRSQLLKQVALILETDRADLLREFVDLLYQQATTLSA